MLFSLLHILDIQNFHELSWNSYYIFSIPTFLPQHCVPIQVYIGPCFRECCFSSENVFEHSEIHKVAVQISATRVEYDNGVAVRNS